MWYGAPLFAGSLKMLIFKLHQLQNKNAKHTLGSADSTKLYKWSSNFIDTLFRCNHLHAIWRSQRRIQTRTLDMVGYMERQHCIMTIRKSLTIKIVNFQYHQQKYYFKLSVSSNRCVSQSNSRNYKNSNYMISCLRRGFSIGTPTLQQVYKMTIVGRNPYTKTDHNQSRSLFLLTSRRG